MIKLLSFVRPLFCTVNLLSGRGRWPGRGECSRGRPEPRGEVGAAWQKCWEASPRMSCRDRGGLSGVGGIQPPRDSRYDMERSPAMALTV